MSDIVVVGHQPQYMPYLGVLHKISKSDIFIIVDHVQYVRKYFYNRTYIKVHNEPLLLTVPVLSKGKYEAPISEIRINYDEGWMRKHLKSIRLGYAAAPYFEEYYPAIERIILKKHDRLSVLTSELLRYFIDVFNLASDVRCSSSMDITGNKTELLIGLTTAVGGNSYLSGQGAKDYLDQELFDRSGYKHSFVEFDHPQYPQMGKGTLDGMGCIDLLFNCGRDGRKYIVNPEAYA